jgi:hypothetical protein
MSLEQRPAYWTFDEEAEREFGQRSYYFAPTNRSPSPYFERRRVEAIIDIANDGTLAGVELVFGDLPPPPRKKAEAK